MPVSVRQRGDDKVAEKISESALKGINPNLPMNKLRMVEIRHIIETISGNKVSSVLVNDLFNILYMPVPQLKEHYPDENKDYFQTISQLAGKLQSSEIRSRTVADVDESAASTVQIAINLIKQLQQMADGQGNQSGKPQDDGKQAGSGSGSVEQQSQVRGQSQQNPASSGIGDRNAAAQLLKKLLEGGLSQQQVDELIKRITDQLMKGNMYNGTSNQPTGRMPSDAAEGTLKRPSSAETLEEMMKHLHEPGDEPGTLEFNKHDPLAAYLSRKTDVRKLLKILKGLPELGSDSSSNQKFLIGEYKGYEFGSSFNSLAPSVYAYPKELLMALYAHRRIPRYDRYVNESDKTRYILFDKSDSMMGDKSVFAKAVAISLYLSSVKENGDFHITYFDQNVYEKLSVLKNSRRDRKDAMVSYLASATQSGGTDIQKAIIAACVDLADDKKSKSKDIILITDGESVIKPEEISEYLNYAKASLIVVYISDQSAGVYLEKLRSVAKSLFVIEHSDKDALVKLVKEIRKG